MKAWQVATGSRGLEGFRLVPADLMDPLPGEVSVRLRAASLNFRDVMIAAGEYPLPVADLLVPMSDACWEVIAVGAGVKHVSVGTRVVNTFLTGWMEGPLEPWMWATAFGATIDGVLTQQRKFPAELLVPVPESLSDVEAATIPCAAVTAWNALFGSPLSALKPGQTVLTLGTGGVSMFSIQLAKAAGARVIVTSSSNAKLQRAHAVGADILINYREVPRWDQAVRAATDGEGADVVIEVGGPGTMAQSLTAVRHGGRVALIGALSDPAATINPGLVLAANATLHGLMAGSRRHLKEVLKAIEINGIKPVVDRVYAFDDAVTAFKDMQLSAHVGKLVITG